MKLLLVGDERKNRRLVAWGFASDPYRVSTATTRGEVAARIAEQGFQAAFIDLQMREDDGLGIVDFLHEQLPRLPLLALLGPGDRRLAPTLRARGVRAHLVSPFPIKLLHATMAAHALTAPVSVERPAPEITAPPAPPPPSPPAALMAGDETARRTLELALRAANSSAAILILGETGTGKTLLAQAIHQNSPLRSRPFVTVNCPCLSHELLESDLFGHVRGAFTGAVQDTWGKVAAAEGGTLFLDEVGDLPMTLQPKLLRLLQEKQYERVGESASRTANVRIIAATNRDLKREVAAGRFREDLFYRLNVIAVDVPPLRRRTGQIMRAAETFLEAICRQLGKPAPTLTTAAQRLLENYGWPGNMRELRNVVERAAILSNGAALDAVDFPALLAQAPATQCQVGAPISLRALEDAHIRMIVASSPSLEEAARILQIDKSTLYRKRKQMEAPVESFPESVEAAVATGG